MKGGECMKISVVFITYKRVDELIRAIDSCIEQEINDMEYIVIDNYVESTLEEELVHLADKTKSQIVYKKMESNLGVSGGRNAGIGLAQGEYIIILDDDAIIQSKNFFEKVLSYIENENIAFGAVKIVEPLENRRVYDYQKSKKDQRLIMNYFGGCHIIKKEFWIKHVKGYPSRLHFGSEELYASLIAWDQEKEIIYFDDLSILHLPSSVSRTVNKERDMNIILNTYIIRKLTYPKIFRPLLALGYKRRLKKNNLKSKEDRMALKEMHSKRYDIREKHRIKIKTVMRLVKNFGWTGVF